MLFEIILTTLSTVTFTPAVFLPRLTKVSAETVGYDAADFAESYAVKITSVTFTQFSKAPVPKVTTSRYKVIEVNSLLSANAYPPTLTPFAAA